VFRFELAVPAKFRHDDQAPRVLTDLERILRERGASTQRRGTTLEFTGGLLRWQGGRGSISWHESTGTQGPHFVLKASVWREVAVVLGLGALVGPPLCWGGHLSVDATIRWLALATALIGGAVVLVAGWQTVRLRGKLSAAIAG
jgi:hypothetical protein